MATRDTVTKAVLTWVLDMLESGQSVAMASVIESSGVFLASLVPEWQ